MPIIGAQVLTSCVCLLRTMRGLSGGEVTDKAAQATGIQNLVELRESNDTQRFRQAAFAKQGSGAASRIYELIPSTDSGGR